MGQSSRWSWSGTGVPALQPQPQASCLIIAADSTALGLRIGCDLARLPIDGRAAGGEAA
jgi:hypothetical protein